MNGYKNPCKSHKQSIRTSLISTKIHNFQIGHQVDASIREKIQVAEQYGETHSVMGISRFWKRSMRTPFTVNTD
jgi:hypothetical protein